MLRYNKLFVSLLAVVGLFVLTATVAQANPILVNGSFEQYVLADGAGMKFTVTNSTAQD